MTLNSRSARSLLSGPVPRALVILLLAAGLVACQSSRDESPSESAPPVVEMTAADYAFQAPDSIPSGWVTFQMENVGEETHEFMLARLPEGRTFEEFRTFVEPLDSLEQLLVEGAIDSTEHEKATEQVTPDWAEQIEFVESGGLVGPGQTGRATLRPEPGRYMIVCFVSSPNGRAHFLRGTNRGITVTEDSSGAEPPEADVTLRSTGQEVSVEGQPRSGEMTVALRVEEPPEDLESSYNPYYWAHIAPLGPETSAEELRDPDLTDEDFHATGFRGGVGEVPVGQSRYFTVDLEPGRYAWMLHSSAEEGFLVKEFTIE